METIQIKNKEVDIITTLGELSITQFIDCSKIISDDSIDNIDKYIKILGLTTDLTQDEIEDLEVSIFKKMSLLFSVIESEISEIFINEIEVDGVTYKSKSDGTSYKFSVKEIVLLKKLIKGNRQETYILDLVAIIFKNVNDSGEIINDISPETISERKELLKNVKMITILPYLKSLEGYVI